MASSISTIIAGVFTMLALAVGAVVTGMARRDHGKGATLGLIGCLVLLFNTLIQVGQSLFITRMFDAFGHRIFELILTLLNLLTTLLFITGLGLLVMGVVARRTPRPQPQPQPWQSGQPAYGAAGYGQQPAQPGYGQPGYPPSGYGQPGQPPHGQPPQGQPAPGAPTPGQPPYGQPASDSPAPTPGQPAPGQSESAPGQGDQG